MSSFPQTTAALCCALATSLAVATEPAPQGVVRLTTSASAEVTKDLMSIAFGTTREGADAGTVQTQLKQALDAALAEAKKVAKPGQVDVQTGAFALAPRYTAKGVVNGWQGSAELVVEGRDLQAIGTLSGRITTLTISRVGYGLSRELREKTEAEISGQAIASFRAKATDYTKQFGYGSYTIREVDINASDAGVPRPGALMRMQAAPASSGDMALPVEAGKGLVSVNVSGTVQMLK